MTKPSKPTYEELVCELEDLLNAVSLKDGSLFKPLLGEEFLKVRDAIGRARGIVARAKGWQGTTLAEESAEDYMASLVASADAIGKSFNQMIVSFAKAVENFSASLRDS